MHFLKPPRSTLTDILTASLPPTQGSLTGCTQIEKKSHVANLRILDLNTNTSQPT